MSAAGGSSGSTDQSTAPLASSVLGIAIIAITGMQLMSTLDGTIVIVALPRMQAELDLSDAGKSWVITAYVLTFGGLLLLGGRVGDAIGQKRAFLSGVGVFTLASLVCGLANDEYTLIAARALQGIGAAVAAPTGLALIATTYAVGQARNQAMAVSAGMQAIGSVLGLVLGGLLTVISWRLAFLMNVPIGIVIIAIAVLRIGETHHERLKLDVTGALLATLGCTSAVLVFTQGPPRGWLDPWVVGAAIAAVVFFVSFLLAERTAENPLVPFSVFNDRNRVATLLSWFLGGGVLLTVTVMVGLLAQDVLGYSAASGGLMRVHCGCKPQPKRRDDRDALRNAAFSGEPRFFYGGDDAAHLKRNKEAAASACGVWNTAAALPLLVALFEQHGRLDGLEPFVSEFGAAFYGYPLNSETVSLVRETWTMPHEVPALDDAIVPMWAGEPLAWRVDA